MAEDSGTFVFVIFILIIIGVLFGPNLYKKYKANQAKAQPGFKTEVMQAPKVDWDKVFNEKKEDTKSPSDSMQATLQHLDEDLKKNKENMAKVLKEVVGIQGDIYNKMKEYYVMSKDLDSKENILKINLDALNAAHLSFNSDNGIKCTNCGVEMEPMQGSNQMMCPKCGRLQNE